VEVHLVGGYAAACDQLRETVLNGGEEKINKGREFTLSARRLLSPYIKFTVIPLLGIYKRGYSALPPLSLFPS
jgi:hypothetical protein